MNAFQPFNHKGFEDWRKRIGDLGGLLCISLKFPEGQEHHLGDPELGLQQFQTNIKTNKQKSMTWVNRDISNLTKLTAPVSELNQRELSKEAPIVLRHFNGRKGKYGAGECLFWEHKVCAKNLNVSYPMLKKIKYLQEDVSLSDFVDWDKFTIQSFGTRLPAKYFKRKISWPKFCTLLIEIGYNILQLDPESFINEKNDKDKKAVTNVN